MAITAAGSTRDVSYSCGRCAFKLNLSSSDRLISSIGPRYSKSSRKGILYFLTIDESRFRMYDEVKCGPYYESPGKWGINRVRTNLLCRNCGSLIGHLQSGPSRSLNCMAVDGEDAGKRFCINIRALQPEGSDGQDESQKGEKMDVQDVEKWKGEEMDGRDSDETEDEKIL